MSLFEELQQENEDLTRRCKAYESRIQFLEKIYEELVAEVLKVREGL